MHLKNLTNLTYLDLAATDVSDVGLSYLAELTKLTQLRLISTQVSDGGIAELQTVLPNCRIAEH